MRETNLSKARRLYAEANDCARTACEVEQSGNAFLAAFLRALACTKADLAQVHHTKHLLAKIAGR
jgi:hypothetical protein